MRTYVYTHVLQPESCHLFCMYVCMYICTCVHTTGETINQYIDILQYLLLQYNTIWPIENIDILHIAIYCNILLDIVLFLAD